MVSIDEITPKMIHQKSQIQTHVLIQSHKDCVLNFIEHVWNKNIFNDMEQFLYRDFIDHSMPFQHFKNQNGLVLYLRELSNKVSHHTVIVDLVVVKDYVLVDTRIHVILVQPETEGDQHIEIINAMRLFRIQDGEIIEHWEFIEQPI